MGYRPTHSPKTRMLVASWLGTWRSLARSAPHFSPASFISGPKKPSTHVLNPDAGSLNVLVGRCPTTCTRGRPTAGTPVEPRLNGAPHAPPTLHQSLHVNTWVDLCFDNVCLFSSIDRQTAGDFRQIITERHLYCTMNYIAVQFRLVNLCSTALHSQQQRWSATGRMV
jgi:hypothetical protein